MTVELIGNCTHCPSMGVPNKTFFTMVNESGMAEVLGHQQTNDPVSATNEDAIKCKDLLKRWTPPEGWGSGLTDQKLKEYFLEFFSRCDGFTTN